MPERYNLTETLKCKDLAPQQRRGIAGCGAPIRYAPQFTPSNKGAKGTLTSLVTPSLEPPAIPPEIPSEERTAIPSVTPTAFQPYTVPEAEEEQVNYGGTSSAQGVIRNRANKEFTPNTSEISEETRRNAVFSEATYKALTNDLDSAQQQIDERLRSERYVIDQDLSNKSMLTIVDTDTGNVTIAYRGSATRADWGFNGLNFLTASNDIKDKHPHMRQIDRHYDEVVAKYGKVDEVTGHSYGGFKALRQASKHNIKANVYNPEVFNNNHDILKTIESNGTDVTIHRTTHDIASYGLVAYNIKKTTPVEGSNLKVNAYSPITGNEDPLRAHGLDNFYNEDAPRDLSWKGRAGTVIGQAGIGFVANKLTENFMEQVASATHAEVDPDLRNTITGGVANVLAEKGARGLGAGSIVSGRPVSLRNAFISGAVTAGVTSELQQHAYDALTSSGVGHDEATILSSTTAGAVGGALEYQTNVAIAYAERRFGGGVISAAVRNAIQRGVARYGLLEAVGTMAGSTAINTARGSRGGWWGAAIGAAIGLGMGIYEVASHHTENEIFALQPSVFEGPDRALGTDAEVRTILKEFNQNGNFTPTALLDLKSRLEARVQSMKREGILAMDIPIKLIQVPEHVVDFETNAVLPGEYTERARLEYVQAMREEQQRLAEEQAQAFRDAPASATGTNLVETISRDPEYQRIFSSNPLDVDALNNRIREVILENQNSEDFYYVVANAEVYPVLQPNGEWKEQKWNEPLPTTSREIYYAPVEEPYVTSATESLSLHTRKHLRRQERREERKLFELLEAESSGNVTDKEQRKLNRYRNQLGSNQLASNLVSVLDSYSRTHEGTRGIWQDEPHPNTKAEHTPIDFEPEDETQP